MIFHPIRIYPFVLPAVKCNRFQAPAMICRPFFRISFCPFVLPAVKCTRARVLGRRWFVARSEFHLFSSQFWAAMKQMQVASLCKLPFAALALAQISSCFCSDQLSHFPAIWSYCARTSCPVGERTRMQVKVTRWVTSVKCLECTSENLVKIDASGGFGKMFARPGGFGKMFSHQGIKCGSWQLKAQSWRRLSAIYPFCWYYMTHSPNL